MGMVYRGGFRTITGLTHPSPVPGVTSRFIPNGIGFRPGGGQVMATCSNMTAVGYIANGPKVNGTVNNFDGKVDIYQTDVDGAIVSKIVEITPDPNTFYAKAVPQGIWFSPDSNYIAIKWSITGNTAATGIYVYSRSNADFTLSQFIQYGNSLIWHSNSINFLVTRTTGQGYPQIGRADLGAPLTTLANASPTLNLGIQGFQWAWCGDDLLGVYADSVDASKNKLVTYRKGAANAVSATRLSYGALVLGGAGNTRILGLNETNRVVLYGPNAAINLINDYNYANGVLTARPGPSVKSATTYGAISYSKTKKRIIMDNGTETRIFQDVGGVFTSVSSSKIAVDYGAVVDIKQNETSGAVMVLGTDEITTYQIPSVGFSPVNNTKRTGANQLMYSWDFQTNINPTVETSFGSAPTMVVKGSPTIAPAPGNAGKNALYLGTAGVDMIALPRQRDLEFMYKAYTLEFWVYQIAKTAPGMIIGDSANRGLQFTSSSSTSSTVQVSTLGQTSTSAGWSSNGITVNKWHFVSIVMNGTTLTTYLNGYQGSGTTVSMLPFNGTSYYPSDLDWAYFCLGGKVNADGSVAGSGFKGYLRGVKLYNYAKSYTGIPFALPTF
jgi:hypothetical protein